MHLESRMSLSSGTLIGRYVMGPLVGAGGMGEVYRARDTELGRDVAIKLLPEMYAVDPDAVHRLQQEARAAAALNHPGVLAVYDFGMHEGRPYIVTELLEGVTLRNRIESGPLPVATVIRYSTEIALALDAAHQKGIIHRDIKPENVFVTKTDSIKILDFGVAKLSLPQTAGQSVLAMTHAGTLPNLIVGTLGYMAPEQARGQAVDQRADIFSFGCLLFEMLERRAAFVRDTPADTLTAVLNDPPPPLTPSADRPSESALNLITRRCLAKDPTERFQSVRDLAFVLGSFGDSTATEARPPVTAPVDATTSRRRSVVGFAVAVAAGAALVSAALAAGVWAGWFSHRAPGSPIEFLVPPPADSWFASAPLPGLDPTAPQVGISPDGRTIAFVSTNDAGVRQLWVRSIDNGTPRPIEGTSQASSWPFWSPDSRFMVFAANGVLSKVDVVTGAIERLCKLPDQGAATPIVTGTWSDGTILFSIGPTGLSRVSAS